MCTAITYKTKDHYFGRNLDLDFSYNETVTITPRNYAFPFRKVENLSHHYAMIGMAYVVDGYPLYYDAVNEMGLSMAGLNFPDYADYCEVREGRDNIAVFELIPWILGQCKNLKEVRKLLEQLNIIKMNFSDSLPITPLHWIIADQENAITLETVKGGMHIYENLMGVLTNSPPFEFHRMNINCYMGLSREEPMNRFSEKVQLSPFSRGMGAIGLPGDLSSTSRFIRAAFTKLNAISDETEEESVSQFFHILGSVEQQRGCVQLGRGRYEKTIYSSCCNMDRGIYYYVTYDNRQITAVDLHREYLDGAELICYQLLKNQKIKRQN